MSDGNTVMATRPALQAVPKDLATTPEGRAPLKIYHPANPATCVPSALLAKACGVDALWTDVTQTPLACWKD